MLNVIVFPSLGLISQYATDYLCKEAYQKHFENYDLLNVSSEHLQTIASTTDPTQIREFLSRNAKKLVVVTYQSLGVLLGCLDGRKIGLIEYDEAHRVTSKRKQKLVFGTDFYETQVFFTATPENKNDVVMYDREHPEKNMCGPVAYEYPYVQGVKDGFLNAFEVCVDMYKEQTNNSLFEIIARSILSRKNNRVLSFHSAVNKKKGKNTTNTNVWNFVDEEAFKTVFLKVQQTEFPELEGYYTDIFFQGMDGTTPADKRTTLLEKLDSTLINQIFILSSCQTLCEGIDTKKANTVFFADPKKCFREIMQNIGRATRPNADHPVSTILIPCWINMEHYAGADGDVVKQDELIREQMQSAGGDYVPILNVLAALKQEDPDLHDMCLYIPNREHKEASLNEQGFQIAGDEDDDDGDEMTYTPEEVEEMKANGEPLEIHTNETIERFNDDDDGDEPMTRLYHDEEDDSYKPIVRLDTNEDDASEADDASASEDEANSDRQIILPPVKPNYPIKMSIHTSSSDIQMLWGVKGALDFSKKICSVVIECEVSKIDPMEVATKIVLFVKKNGRMPRKLRRSRRSSKHPKTPERTLNLEEKLEQSFYGKLTNWKSRFCSNEVRNYLDIELPGWRDAFNLEKNALNTAREIIDFVKTEGRMPIHLSSANTPAEKQERSYARKLDQWKLAIKGKTGVCFPSVRNLLDEEIPGWRDETNFEENALNTAREIVAFYKKKKRVPHVFHLKKKEKATLSIEEQEERIEQEIEQKYTRKLDQWKMSIKGYIKKPMYPSVLTYLDNEMPGWRADQDLKQDAINSSKNIVAFYEKEGRLPKCYFQKKKTNELTPSEQKEKKYSHQITGWKASLKGKGTGTCYVEVIELLDEKIPGWKEPKRRGKQPLLKPTQPAPKKRKRINLVPASSTTTTTHNFPPPSDIGVLHQQYLRMSSTTLHTKFQAEPQLWREYHATRKRTFADRDPASIPCNMIIRELEQIQTKRRRIVVDMGCGEAPIADHFMTKGDERFTFHNYDHHSGGDPRISEADISALPLADASTEIAIMSLALWGTQTNCTQYIKEAHRVLESGGKFYISDSLKKWSPEPLTAENAGELLRTLLTTNGFKIITEDVAHLPFCLFTCLKDY